MRNLILLIACIALWRPASAQEGAFCVDLLKLMPADVSIDTTVCGLYLEQTFVSDLAQCKMEETALPYWGNGNRELGRFISEFPCDKVRGVDAPQRGQVHFIVDLDGRITELGVKNMPPRLSAHLQYYFNQMDAWTPGSCADKASRFTVNLVVQYFPGSTE